MKTSEARKRAEEAAAVHERRREVVQQALERIMDGADYADADALLDGIHDLGGEVVV